MSFWMPFMEQIKEQEELFERMNEERKTKEEIELEDLHKRQKVILNTLEMLGAETVREYKDNQQRINYLSEEIDYIKWFEAEKENIHCFFKLMKESFLLCNDNKIYPRLIDEDNVEFKGCVLNKQNLKRLLKKYGYTVTENTVENNKSVGLIVKYRKEN